MNRNGPKIKKNGKDRQKNYENITKVQKKMAKKLQKKNREKSQQRIETKDKKRIKLGENWRVVANCSLSKADTAYSSD